MNKSMCVVMVFSLISCGGDESVERPTAVATQRSALCNCGAIPPTPAIPATPTDLRRFLAAHRVLYPPTANSAYTTVFRSSLDPNLLYAWGFDVTTNTCLFHVSLAVTDYSLLTSQLGADGFSMAIKNPMSKGDGMQGQLNIPRPPGPTGGPDAWGLAYQTFSAAH